MLSGGMFAVRKEWFTKLGEYDTGMEIWGAENFACMYEVQNFPSATGCVGAF